MSENLDLVRSIFADWERGDYGRTDWAHPDIEFVLADVPDRGVWRGVDGMTEGWLEFLSAWEGHRVEPDEYRELDAERVLVLGRMTARGHTSKVDLDGLRTPGGNLFHISGCTVTRLVVYFDRAHALADVGLAE
jgi:ketosteroid isomerase-like protein